jgi:hypothetical protein
MIIEREEPQMVTATIDGQVVSWVNNYFGSNGGPSTLTSVVRSITTSVAQSYGTSKVTTLKPQVTHPALLKSTLHASVAADSNTWSRTRYYDSESGNSTGLAFLNNMGDNVHSGVFDK